MSESAYHAVMFTCNIDQRGKTIRLVMGVLLETVGLLLGVLWFMSIGPSWLVWPAAAIWISGMFVIFEAVVGWCAVRAMGMEMRNTLFIDFSHVRGFDDVVAEQIQIFYYR